MRQPMKSLIPALAACVLLAACGTSANGAGAGSSSSSPPSGSGTSTGASSGLVRTASNSKLGATVLVDAQGMTLYRLSAEQNGKLICTSAACLAVWRPLTTPSGTMPSGSVGSLGTVKRPNGIEQVTYKGFPLYTFSEDTKAGEANGQGIKDVGTWSAVTVTGGGTAPAPAPSSSSGGGGAY